jgi:hypothetical protein
MKTVVSVPNFLPQLDEFDAQILQTLEKLIGPHSFQEEVGELARMRASLPTSLDGLGACSFSGFLRFSRKLSWAALSAVGSAVRSAGAFDSEMLLRGKRYGQSRNSASISTRGILCDSVYMSLELTPVALQVIRLGIEDFANSCRSSEF